MCSSPEEKADSADRESTSEAEALAAWSAYGRVLAGVIPVDAEAEARVETYMTSLSEGSVTIRPLNRKASLGDRTNHIHARLRSPFFFHKDPNEPDPTSAEVAQFQAELRKQAEEEALEDELRFLEEFSAEFKK